MIRGIDVTDKPNTLLSNNVKNKNKNGLCKVFRQ